MSGRRRTARRLETAIAGAARRATKPTLPGVRRLAGAVNRLEALQWRSLEDAVAGRVVMVTGASAGIGAATATRLGRAGASVVLVARSEDALQVVADEIRAAGGTAYVHPCDLTDLDAVGELTRAVLEQVGRVDILVNNAGRSIRRSLTLSYDRMHDYQRTMQLNYFAPVKLMLGLVPGMRERGFGQVVNVSTAGVQTRVPRFGAYIASKSALDTLCDAWQAETHRDGVRFTTVHMALVRTSMIEATTLYDRFPALTPDDAAAVICDAIVFRPRRVSPSFGRLAAMVDSMSPALMDRVRSRGFHLVDDSSAAKAESSPDVLG